MLVTKYACQRCSKGFSGRKRKYCGYECQRRDAFARKCVHRGVCAVCGVEWAGKPRPQATCSISCAQKFRAAAEGRTSQRTCVGCGCQFKKKKGGGCAGLYCSRECAFACKRQLSSEKKTVRQEARQALLRDSRRPCGCCHKEFESLQPRARYCSARCRAQGMREEWRSSPRAFRCKGCGTAVLAGYGDKRRAFCSPECCCKSQRRAAQLADRVRYRQARKRQAETRKSRLKGGESIDPLMVFREEQWTCWLCHNPIAKDEAAPHPLSPTVDHVIPLAKGGPHTRDNLRCAHFICNARRGDRDIVFDVSSCVTI